MISLRQLTKRYDKAVSKDEGNSGVIAVDKVDIEVEEGEFFTLLGPSGSGKTTTLRMLAGLTIPDGGTIAIKGDVIYDYATHIDVPPHKRGLGMVFQSYAIWPHMTVAKNVAFPLTRRGIGRTMKKAEVAERVGDVLRLVQLDGLENRPATDLSGGQQQRLALARALAHEPKVLLLDEPLSNLDAKLRELMRFELKRIQRRLGITTVYVTHDQGEALGMSNRIAVMNNGKVEQIGRPKDIYDSPASHFVADFIGISNFFKGKVEGSAPGLLTIGTIHGPIVVASDLPLTVGSEVTVSIRPEYVAMKEAKDEGGETQSNVVFGSVRSRAFQGDCVQYQITVGDELIRVQSHPSETLGTGTQVELRLAQERCTLIPSASATVGG